jgi:hypothetical protein
VPWVVGILFKFLPQTGNADPENLPIGLVLRPPDFRQQIFRSEDFADVVCELQQQAVLRADSDTDCRRARLAARSILRSRWEKKRSWVARQASVLTHGLTVAVPWPKTASPGTVGAKSSP